MPSTLVLRVLKLGQEMSDVQDPYLKHQLAEVTEKAFGADVGTENHASVCRALTLLYDDYRRYLQSIIATEESGIAMPVQSEPNHTR